MVYVSGMILRSEVEEYAMIWDIMVSHQVAVLIILFSHFANVTMIDIMSIRYLPKAHLTLT